MKILLLRGNYRGIENNLDKLLEKYSFPKNRCGEIIDYIEKNSILLDNQELVSEYMDNHPNGIIKDKVRKNYYYVYSVDQRVVTEVSIHNIDITRPWEICKNKYTEYYRYLDYKIICKDLNYANKI